MMIRGGELMRFRADLRRFSVLADLSHEIAVTPSGHTHAHEGWVFTPTRNYLPRSYSFIAG